MQAFQSVGTGLSSQQVVPDEREGGNLQVSRAMAGCSFSRLALLGTSSVITFCRIDAGLFDQSKAFAKSARRCKI